MNRRVVPEGVKSVMTVIRTIGIGQAPAGAPPFPTPGSREACQS